MKKTTGAPLVRVVDDDEAMRRSYAFLLTMAGWPVVLYANAAEMLERDDLSTPGCIVLDVRMPGISGLELQHRLAQSRSSLPIIFVTGHGDVDMAVRAVKKGAFDFMLKPVDAERLKAAVAAACEASLSETTLEDSESNLRARFNELSPREKEVFERVAQGALNKTVAFELGIAERTVKFHRASACRKLGLKTPQELAAFWIALQSS